MRALFAPVAVVALAALFLVCAFGPAAFAQPGTEPDNALAEALNLPKQSAQEKVHSLLWQAEYKHPGGQFHVLTHFPQGLSQKVDAKLARFAREQFDETCSSFMVMAGDTAPDSSPDSSPESSPESSTDSAPDGIKSALSAAVEPALAESKEEGMLYYSVFTYQVLRPSAAFASVHFTGHEYTGGAHANWFHVVLSYDLASGRRMEIGDLFADRAEGLPRLINRIADGIQAWKGADAEPVERDPAAIDATMDRVALTPQGIRVIYAPYEMGSFAEGEIIVDIPREELLALGVRPDFWKGSEAGTAAP